MRSVICAFACLVVTVPSAWAAAEGGAVGTVRPSPAPEPGWRWPLAAPSVVRRFDPPPLPWLAGHRGVDLPARAGEQVRAAGPGTVRFADRVAGRGAVTISHPNGLRTTYLPVRASVRPGQTVAAGQVIGVVDDTVGHCRTPCLHWGLLRGDGYLDPLLLFGLGQVRLLPYRPASGQARG